MWYTIHTKKEHLCLRHIYHKQNDITAKFKFGENGFFVGTCKQIFRYNFFHIKVFFSIKLYVKYFKVSL